MSKENEIEKVLGQVIRELRLARSLSQEKLAELGEFERSYISKVENGERAIQFKTLVRFAEAFGIKPSELIHLFELKYDRLNN